MFKSHAVAGTSRPPRFEQGVPSRPHVGPRWPVERGLPGSSRWCVRFRLLVQAPAQFRFCALGTIVATLLSPIGSYFNESNRSSYIGTSYLLSVCCFTPLYGTRRHRFAHVCTLLTDGLLGRLSDILGRKGAMLIALSFFGACICGQVLAEHY